MRYENVNNTEELNFRVNNYVSSGYKVEIRENSYVKLVKDDFSWGIFIILFLFLVIGALIYWAVKNGNKDEVIVQVENTFGDSVGNSVNNEASQTQNSSSNQNPSKDLKCPSCEYENNEDSKFCFNCGTELNNIENFNDMGSQENSENEVKCISCGSSISSDAKFCNVCGVSQTE